jgi:ribose transport system permease protein
MVIIVPIFATQENMINIFANTLPLLIIAIGQTVVLITGGIDLSVTSVVALASIVGASLITSDGGLLSGYSFGVPVTILIMLAIGIAIGLLNGISVTKFHMPPFIVTLTMMMAISGIAIWYSQSLPVYNLPEAFTFLGGGSFSFFPYAAIVVGITLVIVHIILNHTLFGKWVYAIGLSPRTSSISGIPVQRVLIMVYIISAICGVMGALLLTGRLETGSPVMAKGMFLDVVGAVVIGGTSLFGGKGKVVWTVFGVLFITLIDNSLNLMGLQFFTIMMVKGAIILFAAFIDALRNRIVLERV